ncbi:MAG TPA: ferric reductase-like transmembrane domain-containing protein [Candidatus Nitrosocosmicus sp.]|nr:ferric reductase-like transmembrane domain-containing protein [Candidatus Nitrosocosmicus sp.]
MAKTVTKSTNNKKTISHQRNEKIFQYAVAIIVALVLFFIFSIYLYYRRGFYDLYIMNKIFAGVAAVQLGMVLLFGPLSRMFQIYDNLLKFRNEFGIVAFIMAMLHVIFSLFFLGNHFPFASYFTPLNVPFIFGLTAIIILTILFLLSNDVSRKLLRPQFWWKIQYTGVRLAFIATALHVFIMKYPGWIDWYKKGGSSNLLHPEWPGLGLLVGWFLLLVIIMRITEALNSHLGKVVAYIAPIILIAIYIFTFHWGFQMSRN